MNGNKKEKGPTMNKPAFDDFDASIQCEEIDPDPTNCEGAFAMPSDFGFSEKFDDLVDDFESLVDAAQ